MNIQKFTDESENVTKYVFSNDEVCYEAVLYRYPTYEERTVLCISTQCGCPVGCTFCGTGKHFIRNLTTDEICDQVYSIFEDINLIELNNGKINQLIYPDKTQIMFMSMGEPFLNYKAVREAIIRLSIKFTQADMLLSTIGPARNDEFADFIEFSQKFDNVGLQFSIHKAFDRERDKLIPFEQKMNLLAIRDYGVEWYAKTGRRVYLNYCIDGTNCSDKDAVRMLLLFPPSAFALTFSVVCSADETMKEAGHRELEQIRQFESIFKQNCYDTRIFDPAGQDSIGGGCGQLWYVQKWMKENEK